MLYRHNASDPIIMERPSRAAYAGASFQKAIASVASATDGAALNNPAKLFGRKTSASRAKVETTNPPMKKRMTYSVTPWTPRGHAVKLASTFPDAGGDRHSSKIVDCPRATAAAPTCSREAQQHRSRGCDRPELWLGATNVHYRPPFGDHVFRLIHGFPARTSRSGSFSAGRAHSVAFSVIFSTAVMALGLSVAFRPRAPVRAFAC